MHTKETDEIRKWAFSPEGLRTIRELAERGMTMEQIASCIGSTRNTVYRWTKMNQELKGALATGRRTADTMVEESLFEQCLDRRVEEITLEQDAEGNTIRRSVRTRVIPANVTAIQYWLANRSEGRWKTRQQLELVGDPTKPVVFVNDVPRVPPPEDDAVEVICDMEEPEGPDS